MSSSSRHFRWLVSALALTASLVAPVAAQSTCNGHAEFCDRSYSNVSVIGAHNSYGVSKGNLAANQNYTVATQLDNGVRMLQVQGHINGNDLHLCHTSCFLLDAGTFTSYLSTVKTWLDNNPDEVITLLLVNSDGIAPPVWAQSYTDSGLSKYVYTPANVPIAYSEWPTLREMINAGTRVVSFLAQNADVSSVPYLIDEFTNIWETPYDVTDNAFPCTVDRVTGSPENKMALGLVISQYLINHFLDVNMTLLGTTIPVPATQELETTNAATGTGSLGAQASECVAQHGYNPTFTLVDYYDVGDGSVFEYTAKLNGVSYVAEPIGNGTTTSSSNSPKSSGSGTSGSGSVTSSELTGGAMSAAMLSTTGMAMAAAAAGGLLVLLA
ncbi:hypothetical protein C6P46_006435 [Rhodotorula mucilaginosa]|uniref:PLC-like phosphodiesterase n=1 Tax=Rhodotorula mucilaginosa TaxID=5537 RepID=A0A9P6W8M1_RHOMI|nr:hypothetical protein C6P46_006435 [Rhodotorula mucilaginosa]